MFVPDEDVVGDVNKGWLVARATLGNERISIGGGSGGTTGFTADDLDQAARQRSCRNRRVLHAPGGRGDRRVPHAAAVEPAAGDARDRRLEPGPEGNVTKLLVAEAGQRMTELAFELAGSAAVVGQTPTLTQSYLGNRAMTIAGGTSEITRNTIAERILGLPRDPLLK